MTVIRDKTTVNDRVSTKTAFLVLLLSFLFFVTLGLTVGYFFFWDREGPISKLDIDYGRSVRQVKEMPQDPQSYIDLGWVYMQKKDYDLAEREFKYALELEKNNVSAMYNLALLKVQTGELAEAKKLLESIKKNRPDYLKARATLGYVYSETGQLDKALKEFKLVEKHYSSNADLMYQIGRVYERKKDTAGAKQYYTLALKYDPKMEKAGKAISKLK